jgi:pSer/pThr/pTyr-binding forkhead associated (FHA) protein
MPTGLFSTGDVPMEVNLIVANGKLAGKKIPVASSKFLIGRGDECQVRPTSSLVSRRHCLILVEGDSATIEDLGSTNGTFVNNEKLAERRMLKSGDRIKVGMLEVEVQLTIAAKKKAAIQSVQEAAARTVAAASATDDDFDVSRWLSEEDATTTITPPHKGSSVGNDTMAGNAMVDTTTMPVPPPHKEKEDETKKKEKAPQPSAKAIGKILRPAKPTTDSSGAAADDALRHFFHRKKP